MILVAVAFGLGALAGAVITYLAGRDEADALRAELAAERAHAAALARSIVAEREYTARLISSFHEYERNTY